MALSTDSEAPIANSDPPQRLSDIKTLWTVVCRACTAEQASDLALAQKQMLDRYGRVVHRYLLGAVRDAETADELSQEFALRFVRGDLRGVDRERGRFRDFLKGVLSNLVRDHFRRRSRDLRQLPPTDTPATTEEEVTVADEQFLESWRSELLNRAWKALAQFEAESGQPFHTVLKLRAERPVLRSEELAVELAVPLGREVTAAWVRQNLHRARDRFADILLDEVTQTLVNPTLEGLEEELIDVGLITYCRPALDRLRAAE